MALSDTDRKLVDRCVTGKPQAWQDFVDRFMGLVVHVVNQTASSRSLPLSAPDREDLVSEVFLTVIANDYAVLRRFSGRSSLATYLAVIARRVVVHKLIAAMPPGAGASDGEAATQNAVDPGAAPEERITNQEEVDRLLSRLDGPDAQVVRLYHLEGKSYGEISEQTGMPVGSVGPTLSRARLRLRESAEPMG